MGGRTLTETLGAHLLVARATLLTAAGSCPHAAQAGLGAVWSRERHEGELPKGQGERCSRRDLGWRGWGTWGGSSWWGKASGGPSHPPHSCPQKTGADTHPGTRRSPPCSHKTGRLHSWLAPCRIHQCLRRGRQGGDFSPHFTHREAEARVVGQGLARAQRVWLRQQAVRHHRHRGAAGLGLANWRLLVFNLVANCGLGTEFFANGMQTKVTCCAFRLALKQRT